jgi:RimJ/RimL family protein N-acetyltransferase
VKILETDRLVLRHQTRSDLDSLFALYRDPEVIRFIPDAPQTVDAARDELEWHMNGHRNRPELGLWATILKESNAFIGRCGLLPWSIDGQKEVEVAYLIDRAHWGRGLGTEAARAIMYYGFERLNLPRLICLIESQNRPSIRVAEKIGMTFEKQGRDEKGPFLVYSRNKPAIMSGAA